MAYQVELADSAKADAKRIYKWVLDNAPLRGPEWFEELIDCLYSLDKFPNRCPMAREATKARREIRCLIFGQGRNSYRILYQVEQYRETVWILHIRHGAMKDLAPHQISKLPA